MPKIAIISSSSGRAARCRDLLAQRGMEDVPVYELTMQGALEQARQCIGQGVKVIMSVGGTSAYLREHLNVPVIDMGQGFLGILLTIRKARERHKRVGVVGFKDLVEAIRLYNRVMDDDVLTEMVTTESEFEPGFRKLRSQGVDIFVGGLQMEQVCRRAEVPYASLEPETSELKLSLNEGIYLLQIEEEREKRYGFIAAVLNSASEGILSIDTEGRVLHINRAAQRLLGCEEGDFLQEVMPTQKILASMNESAHSFGDLCVVHGYSIVYNSAPILYEGMVTGAVVTLQEERLIQEYDAKIRRRQLGASHRAKKRFGHIIGDSEALTQSMLLAQQFAKTNSSILITGETGTGKEMFAQSIHNGSHRHNAPFVAINCAALPPSILESELFGYVRGAFTGARTEGKAGLFELAHHGTIFLDEISEMSLDVQVKLLRVLQEREIMRIGDDRIIPIDVRVLASTNRDLQQAVENGTFREDLYYRICALELHVPPLRERREDIAILLDHFFDTRKTLTDDALNELRQYQWPGNIRQLSNIAERLCALCRDAVIDSSDVRLALYQSRKPRPREIPALSRANGVLRETDLLARVEQETIQKVLAQTGGNQELAAAILGISVSTLWRKKKKL